MNLAPRTLRARLIAGLLVLLALSCAAVGVATSVAMERFLLTRVDEQIAADGPRFAASLEHGEDTRGQARGTFGARLVGGRVTHAAVVSERDGTHPGLSPDDEAILAALPVGGPPQTVDLSSLDDYRLVAAAGRDGDVMITGLSLHGVEETLNRLWLFELVMFAGALAVTGVAGALWVRLALRPLQRIATTARRVAELPLASGEVTLAERVPDTDPRTETGQVGAAFNRMLGHVEAALGRRHAVEQRLRAFAADASHELRTPLASIRGHAELALRGDEPMADGVRHALGRIDAESGRMSELVDELLLLARLDAGRPLAREEVDLSRLAIEATGDARAAGPGHRWRLELPEDPVTVTGDALRLHQVIASLLSNARVHTPDGTTVVVAVRRRPGAVEVTVEDDGPGVPAGLEEEIFERFSRADQGRSRATGGAGLGLAIVRAVVAAHGGSVDVRSRPGRTEFRLLLPSEG
ncbi:sensor histidine kinase [Nonomuraea aurantiaca]|uniref:sensor histidine kinase n=1 Tax=Nonomuraea aurantiaca TaxID=2878562 RepID=UPI001CD9AA8F|nr:HAMP domain-containing sensor histidine kinase [Nonomuraea aurantiaca]MCA2225120.1 HAMP domain-containing histidine kinase [Nonomuraea aurantiaca]